MEGRCEECKIRDDDFSKKLLFRCRHCEQYFCKKHLSPKMVLTKEFIDSTKDRVLREKLYKEWEREGGHPDWVWSRKHFDDLKIEEGEELKKYLRWFDRLNRIKVTKEQSRPYSPYENGMPPYEPEETPKPEKQQTGSHRTKPPAGAVILFLLVVVFMYSMYRNPDLVKNILNNTKKSNIETTTTTTQQYQTTTTQQYRTLNISYLLDYSFKTIYFSEQFSGEIDEYNIGPPLDGLLKTGWKISYSDLELDLYGTADQKVTVRVKNTFIQKTTTTTIANANLVTPQLLFDRTAFITNSFHVYINDSFLKRIDPNMTKGLYNNSMYSLKKAFSIWEEETKLVHFNVVDSRENYNLYVEWSGDMPTTEGGSQFIAYAAPSIYDCGNYKFVDGGRLVLSVKNNSKEIQTDLHEIGHILNLGDVGNSNALMSTWYDDSQILSEESLRKLITPAINDTLRMIINSDLNCNFGNH